MLFTGEILKGFRKYGPSKEHHPNPIVQMGLLADGNGIPISMCVNPEYMALRHVAPPPLLRMRSLRLSTRFRWLLRQSLPVVIFYK